MLRFSTLLRVLLAFAGLAGSGAAHTLEKEFAAAYEAGQKSRQRGLEQATDLLRLAREKHDEAAEAAALGLIGSQQRYMGRTSEALASGREAARLARASGDQEVLARTLYDLGRTAEALTLIEEAAECFTESAAISERRQDLKAAGNAHTGLANVFHSINSDAKALEHQRRALELAEQEGNPRTIGTYSVNLSGAFLRAGDYARARELIVRATTLLKEHGSRFQYYAALDSLAEVDLAEERYEAARAGLDECLDYLAQRPQETEFYTAALVHRAQALRGLGRLDEALADAQKAVQVAEKNTTRRRLDSALREYATVQAARGAPVEAFAAERRARAVNDTFNTEQTQARLAGMQARLDYELQRSTIDRLDREKRLQSAQLSLREAELLRARRERLAVAGAALLGVASLSTILILQRKRLRAEREARAQSEAARAAADEASRVKTRLLNFASHDLKAPLASLGLAAREIEGVADNPAEVRELAGLVRAEATEMSRLVHDFLDHSTIEAGRLELKPVPLDLGEVAARVAAELRPLAVAKQQTLAVLASAAPLPLVLGEPPRLGQVFGNLLSNAIKFTPPGGRIEVATGHDSAGVWCEVRDTGPGIAAADLARLFQPFSKLSAKPTGGESSTGLGLSLACELVTLHGGVLQVDSQPGRGAVFRVVLAPAEDVAPTT